jgi:hypothetical protein
MNDIPQVSLVDTINVIQLARETALAKGDAAQANRFTPVVSGLQQLASQSLTSGTSTMERSSTILGGDDFSKILETTNSEPASSFSLPSQNVADRNQMIQAMAASDMTHLEIARQMGMSTEEVGLIVNLGERSRSGMETSL